MKTLFGTDGIRSRVGLEPLTQHNLQQCGSAIARWALKKYGENPSLLIGCDTRQSAAWIMAALQAGLLLHPVAVYTTGIVPTPAICSLLSNQRQYNAGLIVSASHNPFYDNGLKIIDAQTGKLSQAEEETISALYHTPETISYTSFGSTQFVDMRKQYIETILSLCAPHFLSGITIVLDCAHGATHHIAPTIFSQLGAQVIALNTSPTGININENCGSLHPDGLQQAIKTHNAHIGFGFDGDGDRLIVATQNGQLKDGDDIIAFLSDHALYKKETHVVGTIMSNMGLEQYLKNKNKTLIRTNVGDKHVTDALKVHTALLGGEPSGHIVLRDYLQIGDGIVSALRVMEHILATNNWQVTTFDKYPHRLINIPVTQKKDLTDPLLANLITDHEAQLESGRLIVRYSGTEPMLRIMIEDRSEEQVEIVGNNLAHALRMQLQ